jgi:serine/threonine protein kinase
MGEVWACRHVHDGRRGALKVLLNGMVADDLARFKREMLALDKLRHHAIVSLIDHDLSSVDRPWLVMEEIEGISLDTAIQKGPLPIEACLRPFSALADGLAQAHAYGVHHRDVKSNNVILRPSGSMVLVDFGAAIEDDSSEVTKAGLMLGTTRYLPPEVICGDERDNVLADIYALGMVLHECLTGTHAFTEPGGSSFNFRDILKYKMSLRYLDPGDDFPDEVRKIVRLCTAADPDDRVNRMEDLADMLEVASGLGGHTPMMSLRQSERINQLKSQPTPAPGPRKAPRPGTRPSVDKTVLRPQQEPEPEETIRIGRPPSESPTAPSPTRGTLPPPEARSGFDWPIFGAVLFWIIGLIGSAGVFAFGLVVAWAQ